MEEYEVFTFEEDVNENVVFLNTTEDLYFLQDEIIENISNKNSQAKTILVDFIINPREVSERIKIKIEEYLKKHNELLYSSSLSKKEIEFIINK